MPKIFCREGVDLVSASCVMIVLSLEKGEE